MLQATSKSPRTEYVVKYGYVYSDPHGNHYGPGDVVSLTDKEFDLARHRVKRYVSPEQVKQEGEARKPSPIYAGKPADPAEPAKAPVKESSKKDAKDEDDELSNIAGVLGNKKYLVK